MYFYKAPKITVLLYSFLWLLTYWFVHLYIYSSRKFLHVQFPLCVVFSISDLFLHTEILHLQILFPLQLFSYLEQKLLLPIGRCYEPRRGSMAP
jgi:hypothetical protein